MIGNDLETSEVLYSILFCIISKERLSANKDNLFLIYHRGWLNAKCNLSFSLILADISSIYPFSEKSELAKTSEK